MSVLSNANLATAISDCNCANIETINTDTKAGLNPTEAIYVVPIGSGGNGVDSETEGDIVDTLVQISHIDARNVIGLITTDYEIVSQNGYPN